MIKCSWISNKTYRPSASVHYNKTKNTGSFKFSKLGNNFLKYLKILSMYSPDAFGALKTQVFQLRTNEFL